MTVLSTMICGRVLSTLCLASGSAGARAQLPNSLVNGSIDSTHPSSFISEHDTAIKRNGVCQ